MTMSTYFTPPITVEVTTSKVDGLFRAVLSLNGDMQLHTACEAPDLPTLIHSVSYILKDAVTPAGAKLRYKTKMIIGDKVVATLDEGDQPPSRPDGWLPIQVGEVVVEDTPFGFSVTLDPKGREYHDDFSILYGAIREEVGKKLNL